MKSIIKSKKAQLNPFGLIPMIFELIMLAPWYLLLIIVMLPLTLILMFFWKIGLIVGVGLIVVGALELRKGSNIWVSLGLMLFGLLIWWNPFEAARLSMMW